jgi:hypothetical protein
MSATLLRLRIESDGTAAGTVVRDAETGRILPVQSVSWRVGVRQTADDWPAEVAMATIVVPFVAVDVLAEADGTVEPERLPPAPCPLPPDLP